jgi:peptide deformylase
MKLKVWQTGDPVLRLNARPLSVDEILSPQTQDLIEWMRETMHDAPGVGLAAPQVGVPLQLAVIEDSAELIHSLSAPQIAERERRPVPFHVVINPTLTVEGDETAEFFEGCLSIAGMMAIVTRAKRVRVECLNQRSEPVAITADGWYARILQHEIDHLRGVLYTDRMNPRSLSTLDNYARHWKNKSIEEFWREIGE